MLDLTTRDALNENTDEYSYRNVVSVATKTRCYSVQMQDGTTLQINDSEMFQLTTSGDTSIEVLLRASQIIDMMGGQRGYTNHSSREGDYGAPEDAAKKSAYVA